MARLEEYVNSVLFEQLYRLLLSRCKMLQPKAEKHCYWTDFLHVILYYSWYIEPLILTRAETLIQKYHKLFKLKWLFDIKVFSTQYGIANWMSWHIFGVVPLWKTTLQNIPQCSQLCKVLLRLKRSERSCFTNLVLLTEFIFCWCFADLSSCDSDRISRFSGLSRLSIRWLLVRLLVRRSFGRAVSSSCVENILSLSSTFSEFFLEAGGFVPHWLNLLPCIRWGSTTHTGSVNLICCERIKFSPWCYSAEWKETLFPMYHNNEACKGPRDSHVMHLR